MNVKKLLSGSIAAILLTPFLALAVQITVPSAPGTGYALVSTTTGAYVATTTNPFHLGSLFVSSATSTFIFGIKSPCFSTDGVNCITSSSGSFPFTPTAYGVSTSTVIGFTNGLMSFSTTTLSGTLTLPSFTSGVLEVDATGKAYKEATSSTSVAGALVVRDSNGNSFFNNFLGNGTLTTSAGGTTVLTAASSRFQALTGSSAQTYQLPDATTLSLGPWFVFNNNSSQSLTITNNGGSTIYTVPAGGISQCGPTNIGSANGSWDCHSYVPSNATWGTGVTGLIFNSALTTTPQIVTGASSAAAPSFIPQRTANTTGFGGDGTNLFASIAGVAKLTITTGGASTTNFTASGEGFFATASTTRQFISELGTPAGAFLAVNPQGQVIATTTPSSGSGTVTSVAQTVPGFLSITGSPVTTTGTLAISYSGTALPAANGGTATTTSGTTNAVWYNDGTNVFTNSSAFTYLNSTHTLTLNGGGAGDAQSTYGATSHEWAVGYKSSDNSFRISSSTALGTSDGLIIDKNLKTTLVNASTTALSASGEIFSATASTTALFISGLPSTMLSTSAAGAVQATTVSSPLSFSGSTLSCATCLTANQSITLSGAVSGTGSTAITTSYAGVLGNTLGGTGIDSSALTGVVKVTAGTWAAVGAQTCTNQFVRAMSAAYVATCATASLTADVTGILPIANGGTNASSFTLSNGIMAYDGTRAVNYTGYTLTSLLATFANASTTNFTASTFAALPTSASCGGFSLGSFCFDTTDNQIQIGTSTAATPAVLSTRTFPLFTVGTTTWAGTTTQNQILAPFAKTI